MNVPDKLRVRFAPSPTGKLHIGGARTALYNYLFARANNATFILRIEDTDRERSSAEAEKAIFDGLSWLGIVPDEGPYYQSKRNELYRTYVRRLLETGNAYRCYCTADELQAMREEQQKNRQTPRYDGRYRPEDVQPQPTALPDESSEERSFVIRLRTPSEGVVEFFDEVIGVIRTACTEIDDFIILRSDGSPTYNLTVVVDDHEMEISHVIRGMDHVSNTAKQCCIYSLLGLTPPIFAHVPLIHGPDGKKFSKRHGATSVVEYKDEGYLPDAFINYLARLGWSYGDQEIFTRQELCDKFSLDRIGKSPAVFDFEKCKWVNSEHIKLAPLSTIAGAVLELAKKDPALARNSQFLTLIQTLIERSKTLKEMAAACEWYFADSEALVYDEAASKVLKSERSENLLRAMLAELETLEEFSETKLQHSFEVVRNELGVGFGKLAQPIRAAVTGTTMSPPIYTVLEILGKSETIRRLENALQRFCGKQ